MGRGEIYLLSIVPQKIGLPELTLMRAPYIMLLLRSFQELNGFQ
jgi:hypothetical protein